MRDMNRKDAGMNGAKLEDTRRDGEKSKDVGANRVKSMHMGINGAGRMGAKIEKSLKGNNTKIKEDWNKQEYLNPEEDPRFHDTYKFLRRYRDATYSLKVVVHQMEKQFQLKYGTSVDEFLDSIYAAGADLSGEQYYWILYYTFLSPQKPNSTNEILEKLRSHISNISYRTYYRKRHKAIESLSTILWGYTAKETIEILNEFFPEE